MSFHKLSRSSLQVLGAIAFCPLLSAAEPPAPYALKSNTITSTSFNVLWDCDIAVDYFLLTCSELLQGKWSGSAIWVENFSPAICASGSPKKITEADFDQYTDKHGWYGEFIYAPPESEGVLQIGKADATGRLFSPPLSGMTQATLVVRAKAMSLQTDNLMTLHWISGGTTNKVFEFALGSALKDMHCHIHQISEGDSFELRSFSSGSKRRVIIDSIAMATDFRAGTIATNAIINNLTVEYSSSPKVQLENLRPDSHYSVSLKSVLNGAHSEMSEACHIDTPSDENAQYPSFWDGPAILKTAPESLTLQWPSVVGAKSYKVSIWTNIVSGASDGQIVWSENFSKAASSVSTRAIASDEHLASDYTDKAGWTIISNVYPSVDAESIRIGNTSRPGEITLPLFDLPPSAAIQITARRQSTNDGDKLSIWAKSDILTREIGLPQNISESQTICTWTIPALSGSERVAIRSAEGKSSFRTIISQVNILKGYSPGTTQCDYAVKDISTGATTFHKDSIPRAAWNISVEAIDSEGASIVTSTNTVDSTEEPPPAVLSALKISTLPLSKNKRIWTEDFSCLTNIFPSNSNSADWTNAQTIQHWQSYYGDESITEITRNHGSHTAKGFYAFWETNLLSQSYAVGTITSDSADEFIFGTVLYNDTQINIASAQIKFDGKQFGFRNAAEQTVYCEYIVTNRLIELSCKYGWTACEELAHTSARDRTSGLNSGKDAPHTIPLCAEIKNLRIRSGEYFGLRWRREHSSSAAAMGIDNITVQFEMQAKPFKIIVR